MRLRPLSAVVMAAGEGTRMRSALPKPLHPLCGRPMLLHVLDALSELLVDRAVVVVGHGAERVTKTLQEYGPPDLFIDFVDQHVQRGTGDAASVASSSSTMRLTRPSLARTTRPMPALSGMRAVSRVAAAFASR